MKVRTGWMIVLAAGLSACGGEGSRAAEGGSADPAAVPAASSPSPAVPAPPPPPSGGRAASTPAPEPTAADSAAAAREDVSPEWKMNQRNMAPYADCMAQANRAPGEARARLQAACANLPDAPK